MIRPLPAAPAIPPGEYRRRYATVDLLIHRNGSKLWRVPKNDIGRQPSPRDWQSNGLEPLLLWSNLRVTMVNFLRIS